MSERVILAYSGGLDTSVAISWIGKETGREVVAVAIDLGQGGEDMEVVRKRALDCGAVGGGRTWRSPASEHSTAARSRPSSSTRRTSSPTSTACPPSSPMRFIWTAT